MIKLQLDIDTTLRTYITSKGYAPMDISIDISMLQYYRNHNMIDKELGYVSEPTNISLLLWISQICQYLSSIGAKHVNIVHCTSYYKNFLKQVLNHSKSFAVDSTLYHIPYYHIDTPIISNYNNDLAVYEKIKNSIDSDILESKDNSIITTTLDKVGKKNYCIIIADDFLSHIPIKQYIKFDNKWFEIAIKSHTHTSTLQYCRIPISSIIENFLQHRYKDLNNGAVIEDSCYRLNYMQKIMQLIKRNKGVGLIIDKGHDGTSDHRYYSTIRSINNHGIQSILTADGKMRISSDVDFVHMFNCIEKTSIPHSNLYKELNLTSAMMYHKTTQNMSGLQNLLRRIAYKNNNSRYCYTIHSNNFEFKEFIPIIKNKQTL